jgi:uncharacterized protein
MTSEHETIRALIAPILANRPCGVCSVYIYGSRAAGLARADSDYDFALAALDPIPRDELESIRDTLIEALPGEPEVDCVDMRRIPLTLAAQVLESGIVLLPGDDYARAMLETRLMSMYANLNEERQGILDDIAERGSVYAR